MNNRYTIFIIIRLLLTTWLLGVFRTTSPTMQVVPTPTKLPRTAVPTVESTRPADTAQVVI